MEIDVEICSMCFCFNFILKQTSAAPRQRVGASYPAYSMPGLDGGFSCIYYHFSTRIFSYWASDAVVRSTSLQCAEQGLSPYTGNWQFVLFWSSSIDDFH